MITNYKELIINNLTEESEYLLFCILNKYGYIFEDLNREPLSDIKLNKRINIIYSRFDVNGNELVCDASDFYEIVKWICFTYESAEKIVTEGVVAQKEGGLYTLNKTELTVEEITKLYESVVLNSKR